MYADYTVFALLEETASNSPVPGGGSMAALGAAVAAGLSEMVANLTLGRRGFEPVQDEMAEIAEKAGGLRKKLLKDIDRDALAYQTVMSAFKLPKTTESEKAHRREEIQCSLKNAAAVPLDVAEDALKIMALAEAVVAGGNPNAVTDGAVGAMMARTAALSAILNVRINLQSIKDDDFVRKMRAQVDALEKKVTLKEKKILSRISL